MGVIYQNLSVPLGRDEARLPGLLHRRLKLRRDQSIHSWRILRKSLDARGGRSPRYEYTVLLELDPEVEDQLLARRRSPVRRHEPRDNISMPSVQAGSRPVVVGSGPAGLFAAYRLVQAGAAPLVLERGPEVTERSKRWFRFLKAGDFDPECHLLFGEGGAGTYSDGKLYTRVKDRRVQEVLDVLVAAGAPGEIAYEAKPHIGSNLLPAVVRNLRKQLIERGAEFWFDSLLADIEVEPTDTGNKLVGVKLGDGRSIATDSVFLAPGHSARDTLRMLADRGLAMEQKPFQMGVRIEHPQELINGIQYGASAGHENLPPADYRWVAKRAAGDVFSFCMCPGGEILPATEREGYICVNGASRYKRIGKFANSGFVVTVEPEQLAPGTSQPLDLLAAQEAIEAKAAAAIKVPFAAPALRLRDFLAGDLSSSVPESSYPMDLVPCPFEEFLPDFVTPAIREGLAILTKRYPALDHEDALVVAPESRSSSPVRMLRDTETLESTSIHGVYPMGEGAGFAGGILSAALDGMRCAEAWARARI